MYFTLFFTYSKSGNSQVTQDLLLHVEDFLNWSVYLTNEYMVLQSQGVHLEDFKTSKTLEDFRTLKTCFNSKVNHNCNVLNTT